MKSLARPSFFRVFDLLLSTTNPGIKLSSWTHGGINWERERHSFSGPRHGQTIEIVTLTRPGKRGWSLMVVKEYWWVGKENKPIKALRWAKPIEGQRIDIMEWFRTQELGFIPRSAIREPTSRQEPDVAEEIEIFGEVDDDAEK
jgi:hypothetical protein